MSDDFNPIETDLYHGLTEEEALAAATQGAREQAASVVILPDGWERLSDSYPEFRAAVSDYMPHVFADSKWVRFGGIAYYPEDIRALAARLVEAAAIVEQVRAGAR